jgi:GTP-binding protein
MQVGAPQVIFKEENGKKLEPIEQLVVSVEDQFSGTLIEAISNRKGIMKQMHSVNGLTTIEFEIPTRGLL